MVRPKTKERRGHRTYHGKHKNQRGGGTRGGRGDAGKCKHHYMRSMLLGTEMGRHGFVRLPLSGEMKTVNVDVLDQMAGPDGRIELTEMKVLGRGRVTRRLDVSAAGFSAAAKSKIEAAGGQAVVV
ncbi:MAG TPA: uL15m family ribosomal protein [Methanothrix sp.]|nr:uL15 family ribosomal protein [Methanothrix sp.]HOV81696.1 uL15m family ribosomal protein [Methanothrix sp.]HPC89845.1 uL15m family ribosomal protein [Methanothrix sp.]HQE88354.1 uL15m family ribosomal protein [Methanothrix sp.]HQI67644.1 uL15m family ribosomal protein [Methanothrix sp.]